MNILSLESIEKSFHDRMLFQKASFFLQEREKVGIIGINGTGKSTLLKLIAGIQEPDAGKRTVASHIKIQFLEQSPQFDEEKTVLGYLLEKLKKEVEWDMEGEAKAMLETLGISDIHQPIGELSGGQKKRLSLAEVLLKPCDILILDEPTNHLDLAMADWLEQFLKKWNKCLVMVTHDRYFLDAVVNRIVEVDHGSIYSYETNYSGFLKAKTEREAIEDAGERKRRSILKNELAWVMRGARARSTKQKARLERFEELKNTSAPQRDKKVEMASVSTRMGNQTIELDHVSKSYGDTVLISDFTYIFLKRDRVGFIGSNGAGKTTLMKMIAGALKPDSGTITVGQTIKIGYYSQEILYGRPKDADSKELFLAYMDPSLRVIDYIKETAEYVRTQDGLISASAMLERFLFPPEEQYGLIEKLSGGEKRRLNLLRVLMEAPNVLILDEPTNDLDVTTLAILEDYLEHFDGIVITVSHDRYFLDRIVSRIFAFEENGSLKQYEGGYTDYMEKVGKSVSPGESVSVKEKKEKTSYKDHKPKKLKFSYKEAREYETIETDIAELEGKLEQIEVDMAENARDFVKLRDLTKQQEEIEAELDEKISRWEYLEDLAERIAQQ